MHHEEHNACYPQDEQGRKSGPKPDRLVVSDTYAEIHVSPPGGLCKSRARMPSPGRSVATDSFSDGNVEQPLMAPLTSPSPPAVFLSRSSWVAQAFQYMLSESGMSLIAAFVLFLLSLVGIMTMSFIGSPRTTGILSKLGAMYTDDNEAQQAWIFSAMPAVLTLLETGLQMMVVPALAVGLLGIFVFGNPGRRRPGYWLTAYSCAAVFLGLALLSLLLRVILGGKLSGLEKNMNSVLHELWNTLEGDGALCQWEKTFPCSGFHLCCVTNSTALADEEDGLAQSGAWATLCFVTLPNGTAATRDGRDVTALVQAQCGLLGEVGGGYGHGRTTACSQKVSMSIAGRNAERLVTCENYVLGNLTSTLGFSLCLLSGMSVCSLVSGVVAVISNLQRSRTPDFALLEDVDATECASAMRDK
ncbi:hypothetical protein ABL78_4058 [Leptomonas seymouri]|uniref:Transmembrane protein n=1 Tax=Leptomonas seymouri TaxID=5684 RepID=A0A0N1IKK0_LEPSE|nr:hypothetical protein ABL78_4058 [Leptomonas seymouri]|eukprot:KPI86868.1 hypothetical protein ABL78_4058 [Leptomonas seymouri]